MIPLGPRTFTVPLWPVYRDGVLVAAFVSFEAAAAFEDDLEAEADIEISASWEPTPIYGEAADAVTVSTLAADLLDLSPVNRVLDLLDASDFPHKADGVTKRGRRK
jgi:hypothetical protein